MNTEEWFDFSRFKGRMHNRMSKGEEEYGTSSFDRKVIELIEEAQEELLDTANWAFLAWQKLEKLLVKLRAAGIE